MYLIRLCVSILPFCGSDGRLNKVNQRQARLVPSRYPISHPGQLTLAIPLWVGAVSTGGS